MAEFVGLAFMLLAVLLIALPILSFLRLARISAELEALRERVEALEHPRSVEAREETPAIEPDAALIVSGQHVAPGPAEPVPEDAAEDLEERLGGRGLLYVGVLVLLIGVSFFLKYAFDNEWVGQAGRVWLGALAGMALIVSGMRFARSGLDIFGHALMGTGLAILYLAIYAALNFYALVGSGAAFALMLAVTLSAALLADRHRSQPLAFIAVGGGFLTPFLVGTDDSAQLMLFSYDALLVAATLALSWRHHWLALNAASYVLSCVTLAAWAARYYTPDQWLRTLLFLTLFCVLFLIILRETRRAPGRTARLVSWLLATGPVLYHLSAIVITAARPPAIHVYLIAFTAAGLWLSAEPHRPPVRLAVLIAAFAPMFGTLTLPDGLSWVMANVVTVAAVAALHLMAILDRILRQREHLATSELVAMHVAGIGTFSLLSSALRPAYPQIGGSLAALLALAAVGLWQWLQRRDHVASLNAAALAFTLGALAVAVQLDGPPVVMGWAAQGAAATWVGLRVRNRPFGIGGLALFTLAAARLLDGYFQTPAAFVVLLNARTLATLTVVALGYALAVLFTRYPVVHAGRVRAALHAACSLLTLLWLTAEIDSFWDVRYGSPQAYLYQHVMLSLAWGVYGALLIAAGMWRRYAVARYIGMTVIAITALKVFFFDLWELGGIYRVIGFIGFGALLVLVSYLYQKRRALAAASDAIVPPIEEPTR